MSYSIENLKKLRSLTEVAIRECIKALDTNNDDLSKALEWIKENSLSASKSSRFSVAEKLNKFGIVRISNVGNKIVTFVLKCESDFVAVNSVFTTLADDIATLLIRKFVIFVNYSQEELSKELNSLISVASYSLSEKIYIEKINFFSKEETEVFGWYIHYNRKVGAFVVVNKNGREVARELATQVVANSPTFLAIENIPHEILSSKTEEIRQLVDENSNKEVKTSERIVEGMFKKWVSEVCFLEQNNFREPGKKIRQIIDSTGTEIKQFFLVNIND